MPFASKQVALSIYVSTKAKTYILQIKV